MLPRTTRRSKGRSACQDGGGRGRIQGEPRPPEATAVRGRSRGPPASLYRSRTFASRERPMTTFDDRKDSFERKFAHDEELRFKATARRNKLLGLWAAEKLGRSGAEADAYAKSVVLADFEEAGDGDVTRKVKSDLEAGGVAITEGEIKSRMAELMDKAIEDVKAGR